MNKKLTQLLPYSVYADSQPEDLSAPLVSMLAHSSDDFRVRRPTGIQSVIACPPGRIWRRNIHSIMMFTFLEQKLTLKLLDDMAEILAQRFIDTMILPDIHPLGVTSLEELSNSCPRTLTKLTKTGLLLYNTTIQ